MGPLNTLDTKLETELKKNFRIENLPVRKLKSPLFTPEKLLSNISFDVQELETELQREIAVEFIIKKLKEDKVSLIIEPQDLKEDKRFLSYRHYKYFSYVANRVWLNLIGY